MFKRKYLVALLALLFTLFMLAACGGGADDTSKDDGDADTTEDSGDSEAAGEPQKGGTLTGAMHTAPTGQFNPLFYEEAYEANILDFTHEALFAQNNDLEFEPSIAKEWEVNDDHTELVVKMEEGIKWHDGEDLTAHDVVFTYQSIADPDYVNAGGIRTYYADQLVSYEAYNSGETDEFEGVVAEDDYTVVFKFAEPNVTPEYLASFNIIPKHIFEDIPVKDMPEAEESLQAGKVIGSGPFKFTEMVEREQYVLEKFEDYWQGEPNLDKIVWKVVDQSVMVSLLETGEVNFIAEPSSIAPADYETLAGYEHLEIMEIPDFGYQLLGFKQNHRTAEDVEAGEINPDNWVPNENIPKEVRQAIAYAVDRQALIGTGPGEGLLHGHGSIINSPIALQFWAYDEDAAIPYEHDPDKAAEILDEAGYKMGDDGFRTDPDGNEWVVNLNYPLGNELRERAAPIIQEFLENVGIKVDLRQPKEMSVYIEDLTDDNSDWDMYMLGWSLGSGDPDPLGLWGTKDAYNYGRWNNEESEKLLREAIQAPEAFEQDYRAEKYSEWTHLFSDDLPALILFAQNKIWVYDKNLHGLDTRPYKFNNNAHLWWLEQE
ncbi:ABC transporter substrate-binding protein [Pseudogracilibacillus auburnensis]|uniref:Peptide/nickel transport system substrate-binding protein n=1 Tax=Pseudogracilibacillus auburnensis TaxID=1494959 RepID=A0A2V3W111_9BACI|nr:ABC transporter substrate-binding protein [Pseudogracilibacillus auburnensis]MBO1002843.1 peptide ABC transporter substrate-binding protein [Pseudogracilibacillus auburnensis]PXW87977.1 peptide/nickel transport system substrate-binding protein [Pseudogracilibacillus auburnensis]